MKPIWHRNFKDWSGPEVRDVFDLTINNRNSLFLHWLAAEDFAETSLAPETERLRSKLFEYQFGWNEVELMMQFIGPLLSYINFDGKRYGLYFHRKIKTTLHGQPLGGVVDGMVATGYHDPIKPFFFLNEYKRSQGYDADPEGQLLIAMVAAQAENKDRQPVYGCYVIGKIWNFVLLEGNTLAVSQGYDATNEGELLTIYSILMHTKEIIEKRVAELK